MQQRGQRMAYVDRSALLVHAADTLSKRALHTIDDALGVRHTATLAVGQVALDGRTLRIAAADPAALRPFTPPSVATAPGSASSETDTSTALSSRIPSAAPQRGLRTTSTRGGSEA